MTTTEAASVTRTLEAPGATLVCDVRRNSDSSEPILFLNKDADPDLHAIIAGLARSLLPVMERAKIGTAEEVDVDTLSERLRAEAIEKSESVVYGPRLVGAWARKA